MMRIPREERHDVAFVMGAMAGGVAAATVTLFQAPQSGARTRADLARALGRVGPVVSSALSAARDGLVAVARGTGATADQARARAAGTLSAAGRILPGHDRDDPAQATDELPAVDELVASAPTGTRPAAMTGPLAARPFGEGPIATGGGPVGSAAEAAVVLEAAALRGRDGSMSGAPVDQVIDGPRPANVSPDR
ncbi:MAG: hypothetical protein H0U40_06235 [Chloroflexia bacterium]|nr:hypothetical protein [Chloroflexia bacterium]